MVVIADAGLPVPPHVEILDLALAPGIPSLEDALTVLKDALVIEEVLVADEMARVNADRRAIVARLFAGEDKLKSVPHAEIEDRLPKVKLVVQTGECSPYGNVVLVGGLDSSSSGWRIRKQSG